MMMAQKSEKPHWRPSAARLVGELVIIVLGVLIALWADGWVQERAEREVEASRIVALGDNVSATRARLAEARSEAEGAAEALRQIALWEVVPELDRETERVLLEGLLFGPSFTPEINVYIDLKSSGDLALLRSAELRQALARMDAALEQLRLAQDDLTSVQQLNYDPFVIEHLSLDGGFAEYLGLEGVPRSRSPGPDGMRILRNLALFKLDLVSWLLTEIGQADQTLELVDAALHGPR
jgi:hypothetical protein